MKKTFTAVSVLIMALAICSFASCTDSEFSGITDESMKSISINAVNANEDDFVVTGSLEVEEGEQLAAASNLEKGSVYIEILIDEEMDNPDEVPDVESADVIATFLAKGTDSAKYEVVPGSYTIKATCKEKKTSGTIDLTVEKAD